jgi:hypothetical protein
LRSALSCSLSMYLPRGAGRERMAGHGAGLGPIVSPMVGESITKLTVVFGFWWVRRQSHAAVQDAFDDDGALATMNEGIMAKRLQVRCAA